MISCSLTESAARVIFGLDFTKMPSVFHLSPRMMTTGKLQSMVLAPTVVSQEARFVILSPSLHWGLHFQQRTRQRTYGNNVESSDCDRIEIVRGRDSVSTADGDWDDVDTVKDWGVEGGEDIGVEAAEVLPANLVDCKSRFRTHAFCNSVSVPTHVGLECISSGGGGRHVGPMAVGISRRSMLHCIVYHCNRQHAEACTRGLMTFDEERCTDQIPIAITRRELDSGRIGPFPSFRYWTEILVREATPF